MKLQIQISNLQQKKVLLSVWNKIEQFNFKNISKLRSGLGWAPNPCRGSFGIILPSLEFLTEMVIPSRSVLCTCWA